MRGFRYSAVLFAAFCGTASMCAAQTTSPSEVSAEIFAPGIISGPANDGAPAFTPDGNTLYFERVGGSWGFILESHRVNGQWTEPTVASFSGQWADLQPALSPDGGSLIFASNRPPDSAHPAKLPEGENLWRTERRGTGWSEPVRLPDVVNISRRIFKPSMAANGNLYFMATDPSTTKWRLYRSVYRDGAYQKAEPLAFSDGTTSDVDPEIAPDESFLLFSSNGRRKDDQSHERLFIVFNKKAGWGDIIPIHYAGDGAKNPADDGEAHLSPDGRTVYFNSSRTVPIHYSRTREQAAKDFARLNLWDNGNSNVWFLSLAPWLDAEKAGTPMPAAS